MRVAASNVSRSFSIKVERIKASLDDEEDFYWFYVRLHLEPTGSGKVQFSDIALVEYHLRHESFSANPNIRISNPKGGFEYKFWLYGFIQVDADIVFKSGEVAALPITNLEWAVTADELKRNGKRELSW